MQASFVLSFALSSTKAVGNERAAWHVLMDVLCADVPMFAQAIYPHIYIYIYIYMYIYKMCTHAHRRLCVPVSLCHEDLALAPERL